MDDRCIMPTLEAKRRGIGLHLEGEKTDLFAALSEEEENRDRIVSQLKGEKKWRNEGNEIPG